MQGTSSRFFKPWVSKKPTLGATRAKNFITPYTSSGINYYKGNTAMMVTPFLASFLKKDKTIILDKPGSVSFEFVSKADDKLDFDKSRYFVVGVRELAEILITDQGDILELHRRTKVPGRDNQYSNDDFSISCDVDAVKFNLKCTSDEQETMSDISVSLTHGEFYMLKKLLEQNLTLITGFTSGQVNIFTEKDSVNPANF